jgi:hypothetical protein
METPRRPTPKTDDILDLLLDALAERQAARSASGGSGRPTPSPRPAPEPPARPAESAEDAAPAPRPPDRITPTRSTLRPDEPGWEPPARVPEIGMNRLLARLLLIIAGLVLVMNVPVTTYGASLARALPDSAALVLRDGVVLKGSGPEIYVLENDRLRWISSMDAFMHRGLTWGDVHVVEDAFLAKFEAGAPLHVLLKCAGSPHIYRLEGGEKRWIRDIDTFLAEGHVWEDVRMVDCAYLRALPDGAPIPADAGPAPQP